MTEILLILTLLLQIVICGISTASICRTIAYYDGPYGIFPRIKNSMLPRVHLSAGTIDQPIENITDLSDKFNEILMEHQKKDGELTLWSTYHSIYNSSFYNSTRGVIYNILDCPFCLGPYVSLFMAVLMSLYMGIDKMSLLEIPLITLGSYGIHFMISKRWEDGPNS